MCVFCRLSGGELFEFLIEQEYLTENEAMGFTKQVVEAVHFLHDRHIVHLDIKVIHLFVNMFLYLVFGCALYYILSSEN